MLCAANASSVRKAFNCSICCAEQLVFFTISAMNVEPNDLFMVGSYVQFERSDGSKVVAEINGLSERGPEYHCMPL